LTITNFSTNEEPNTTIKDITIIFTNQLSLKSSHPEIIFPILYILVLHHQLRQSSRLSSCVSSCNFGFIFLIFLWDKKWITTFVEVFFIYFYRLKSFKHICLKDLGENNGVQQKRKFTLIVVWALT